MRLFGIAGFAHETVFPGETTNSYLYGGLKDIAIGALIAPALTTAGNFNNAIAVGGGGGSLRGSPSSPRCSPSAPRASSDPA